MSETRCLRHKDHLSTGFCAQCNRPYCGDCVVETLGYGFCCRECVDKYVGFHRRMAADKRRPGFLARMVRAIVKLAVLAAVCWLGWYLLKTPSGRALLDRSLEALRSLTGR